MFIIKSKETLCPITYHGLTLKSGNLVLNFLARLCCMEDHLNQDYSFFGIL